MLPQERAWLEKVKGEMRMGVGQTGETLNARSKNPDFTNKDAQKTTSWKGAWWTWNGKHWGQRFTRSFSHNRGSDKEGHLLEEPDQFSSG